MNLCFANDVIIYSDKTAQTDKMRHDVIEIEKKLDTT